MKTGLLFVDELRGFYKSKVMVFLWIGLPIIALLFRFISAGSSGQNISFTLISALIVSSIGGTLASVMLAVFIINEKNRHVYDLFLIRPLKRRDIILAKFFSVYTCVAIASFIAILAGMITDYITTGSLSTAVLSNAGQSLATSFVNDCSVMCCGCANRSRFALGSRRSNIGHLRWKPDFSYSPDTNPIEYTRGNNIYNPSCRSCGFRIAFRSSSFV